MQEVATNAPSPSAAPLTKRKRSIFSRPMLEPTVAWPRADVKLLAGRTGGAGAAPPGPRARARSPAPRPLEAGRGGSGNGRSCQCGAPGSAWNPASLWRVGPAHASIELRGDGRERAEGANARHATGEAAANR